MLGRSAIPWRYLLAAWLAWLPANTLLRADELEAVEVEGQPLAANVLRLAEALTYLGAPLPEPLSKELAEAADRRDAERLQRLLDPQVLVVVSLNPESRVKVERGPAKAALQQAGFTPVLI